MIILSRLALSIAISHIQIEAIQTTAADSLRCREADVRARSESDSEGALESIACLVELHNFLGQYIARNIEGEEGNFYR